MNCLEFRRHLGADPMSNVIDFQKHRGECARCADVYEDAQLFDGNLARALSVSVPAQLAERILFAQTTAERQHKQQLTRRWTLGLAAAAALVLTVGLSLRSRDAQASLSEQAVAHLDHEPKALLTHDMLPEAIVRREFADQGVNLVNAVAVSYINHCPIGRYNTVHMVVPETSGPVTVLYVTNHREALRSDMQRDQWRVRSIPLGAGTLVMVAKDSSMFDSVEGSFRQALDVRVAATTAVATSATREWAIR
jgi:Protein of unknown function (DUF3379)